MNESRVDLISVRIFHNSNHALTHSTFKNGCSISSPAVFLSSGSQASIIFTKDKTVSLSSFSKAGSESSMLRFGIKSEYRNLPK